MSTGSSQISIVNFQPATGNQQSKIDSSQFIKMAQPV
jgi:hypothetical protein